MSRLTSSPFHKPSPFQFPRAPPSPPDTNSDTFMAGIPILSSSQSLAGQDYIASDAGHPTSGAETPGSRMRKSSSIPYHSSGFRENKERTSQKVGKPLIIVIPPATLLQEHGQHGHTLTSGPYHRLSQGVVMPLLPSMFGQLTAIAREFSFPSTTGLCLYYHYVEDGLTLTPRISDDSWQTLWGHLSETLLPNERRPLISGKIEFDLDHRVARWYTAWVSSIYREISDANHHYPSTAPSLGHLRAESRTTAPDGRAYDDDACENSVIVQHSAPITRHVPRKLSLVERFETSSVRPDIKSAPRSIGLPPELFPNTSQAQVLSPIVQEEEPKTARQDLNSRVKSWRASAVVASTPLAATGQTSLEPANLPNGMILDNEEQEAELQMEDFTWSISSAGPQSCGEISPTSLAWGRVPSVHLDSRLEGSVCSTPSVQTSFGPSDHDPFSPTSSSFARIPSPDIAQRFFEDSPQTPMTATSWGAPLSYPPTPQSRFTRVPSPDIAQRLYEDSPPTPMTATSWGAPLSYPSSPRCLSPVSSLDLGERSRFDDHDVALHHSQVSYSIWRASLAQSEEVWTHVWPYNKDKSNLKDYVALISPKETSHAKRVDNWGHVWPYNHRATGSSSCASSANSGTVRVANDTKYSGNWRHVWPYNSAVLQLSSGGPEGAHLLANQPSLDYPYLDIYADVYPYNLENIYRTIIGLDTAATLTVDKAAYPYNLTNLYQPISRKRDHTSCDSHSGAYPHNLGNIYTSLHRDQDNVSCRVGASTHFHNLAKIYPLSPRKTQQAAQRTFAKAYPHNLADIYPPVPRRTETASQKAHLDAYPHNLANIYSIVYPHNLTSIYPVCQRRSVLRDTYLLGYPHNLTRICLSVTRQKEYLAQGPDMNAYPYNLLNIYPIVPRSKEYASPNTFLAGYPHNLANIYPGISRREDCVTRSADMKGYPHNLTNIYSPIPQHKEPVWPTGGYPNNISNRYSIIDRGVDVYPQNLANIYPCLVKSLRSTVAQYAGVEYPFFNLYPSTTQPLFAHYSLHLCTPKGQYPDFEMYPDILGQSLPLSPSSSATEGRSQVVYPTFNIYPVAYPFFDLYPSIGTQEGRDCDSKPKPFPILEKLPSVTASLATDLTDPSVYPHFNLYPVIHGHVHEEGKGYVQGQGDEMTVKLQHTYPFFDIYPGVYPNIGIYPQEHSSTIVLSSGIAADEEIGQGQSPTLRSMYPFFNIYPNVYPYLDIYPTLSGCMIVEASESRSSTQGPLSRVIYPYFDIYSASEGWTNTVVYPNFQLYPVTTRDIDNIKHEYPPMGTSIRYPVFNLYPAIYPHFDLYPPLHSVQIAAPETKTKSSSRLTHAELHAMVMMENVGSIRMFDDLGLENRTPRYQNDINHHIPDIMEGNERSSSRHRTPISANATIASSSTHSVAVRTPAASRNSTFIQNMRQHSESPTRAFSTQTLSPPSNLLPQPHYSLPPRPSYALQDRNAILRSSSLRESPAPKPSNIPPVKFSPRRRDSLVLQRVKAYDSNVETTSGLSKDTLLKFPMPPRLPLPPLPIDRGK